MRLVGVLLAALAAASCTRTSNDEVRRLVDERLVEVGIVPQLDASAPKSANSSLSSAVDADPVAASLAFLGHLDALMKDYRPSLPPVEDEGDILRCVTTEAAQSNAELTKAKATLNAHTAAAKKERARREDDFYKTIYPVAFRIDLDWRTRKTAPVPATWRCFNTSFNGYWDIRVGTWAPATGQFQTKEGCDNHYGFEWRQFTPARPAVYLYSNSETPPTRPPELMRRLETAKLAVPQRFSCRVADVTLLGERRLVKCHGTSTAALRLSGAPGSTLNVGDEVSVPLADTHRDPDGVLIRIPQPGSEAVWTVDADVATLRVDRAAKCPRVEEITSALGKGAP